MEIMYLSASVHVELIRDDAMAIIGSLRPLGTDLVNELEDCVFGMRFFSLKNLSADDFNTAYDLVMKADSLNVAVKDEIKQAFEADPRFKAVETA